MAAQSYEPTPGELSLLDTVIRAVARARRLACGDFQDFAQTVHLKLLERRYDAFSRFRGDSSLRTYLTVVVTRILLEWRNARSGKWRPSAGDPIAARERMERAHQVRRALRRAYLTLPPDDQRLLALRYERSMSVRQIGEDLALDPKALYRRFDRLASKLRRALGKATDLDLSASF